ncbi:MAG: SDR family NAD(P)-dependent oxidoreductase, partial [Gemmatimonadetes bacterium]|nr:SDR family NAD(P)-dependent oxidoreductase [Gemmatimonadota bacterium]
MLTGHTAVITGASRGIGAATARALAAAGMRLALVARGADALHTLAAELAAEFGDGHLVAPADCTDAVDVAALAAAVMQWAGGAPDILVNNAGVYPRALLLNQDPEEFAKTLDLNLTADDGWTLYVNGRRTASDVFWQRISQYDLRPYVHPGVNTIAIEAHNNVSPCGLTAGVHVSYEDGTVAHQFTGTD